MYRRKRSQIAFVYVVASAIVATCIILYSLMAELSLWQSLVLLLGVLVVVWAIIFSFLEVGRIASRSHKISGPDEALDPDAAAGGNCGTVDRRPLPAPRELSREPWNGSGPIHLAASRRHALR